MSKRLRRAGPVNMAARRPARTQRITTLLAAGPEPITATSKLTQTPHHQIVGILSQLSSPAFQPFFCDITPVVHALEMNSRDGGVSVRDRRGKIGPRRRNAEHPPTSGLQTARAEPCSSLEYPGVA